MNEQNGAEQSCTMNKVVSRVQELPEEDMRSCKNSDRLAKQPLAVH